MKKICFFIGNLNLTGGTERVTSVLSNILSEKGYQVSILSIFEGLSPNFEISNNIKLYQLFSQKVSMKFNFFNSIVRIRKFVIEHEIETFIIVDSISCIFTIPALLGLKINHICWEHFNLEMNLGSKFRGIARLLATKYCDHIVVLTRTDKQKWLHYYKDINAKLHTIYNPNSFSVVPKVNSNSKNVLFVGRLSYEKGCDLLVHAWSKVVKSKPYYKLKIVGDGIEKKKLIELCKVLNIEDSVEFMGFCNSLSQEYNDAKILCLPSRSEGFGMVIVEANSFGLPVISFDVETGPKELIENNVNGYRIFDFDLDLLKIKIIEYMEMKEDEYDVFSEKCKQSVAKFNSEDIFLIWKEII